MPSDTLTATSLKPNVPQAAIWLGGLGLVPFAMMVAALHFGPTEQTALMGSALIGYSAVILSFLGGIAWGRCLSSDSEMRPKIQTRMIMISNVPPLLAWTALLLEFDTGLMLLMACFAAMLAVDLKLVGLHLYPAWFRWLRVPLTLSVISILAFACFA